MKIKVNKHQICSWTWSLDYDPEATDTESGWVVILEKVHPTYEWLRHAILHHAPTWVRVLIEYTPWWSRYEERMTNDLVRLPISDEMAAELCLPLWEHVNEVIAEVDGE